MAKQSEGDEVVDRQRLERLEKEMSDIATRNHLEFVRARWVLLRRNKVAARLGEPLRTFDDFLAPARRRSF